MAASLQQAQQRADEIEKLVETIGTRCDSVEEISEQSRALKQELEQRQRTLKDAAKELHGLGVAAGSRRRGASWTITPSACCRRSPPPSSALPRWAPFPQAGGSHGEPPVGGEAPRPIRRDGSPSGTWWTRASPGRSSSSPRGRIPSRPSGRPRAHVRHRREDGERCTADHLGASGDCRQPDAARRRAGPARAGAGHREHAR